MSEADTERPEKPMGITVEQTDLSGTEATLPADPSELLETSTEDDARRAEIDIEQPAEGSAAVELKEPSSMDDVLLEPEETLKPEGEKRSQIASGEQDVLPEPEQVLKTTMGVETEVDSVIETAQPVLPGEKESQSHSSSSAPNDEEKKKFNPQEVQLLLDELNRAKLRLATTNTLLLAQSSHGAAAALAGFPPTFPPLGFPPHPMDMAFNPMAMIGQQQYPYYQNPYLAPPPFHGPPPPPPPPPVPMVPNHLAHQPFVPFNPMLHQERAATGPGIPAAAATTAKVDHSNRNTHQSRKNTTKRAASDRKLPARSASETNDSADRKISGKISEKCALSVKARVVGDADLICVPLALPSDQDHLSSFQCALRRQIELFEASREDAFGNAQGRNKSILVGQVGIRCRHCYSFYETGTKKPRGAIYFPTNLAGIYQAAQNMAVNHFFEESCKYIPPSEMADLIKQKSYKTYKVGGGKGYWTMGGQIKGACEFQERLWFAKESAAAEDTADATEAETLPTKVAIAVVPNNPSQPAAIRVKEQVKDNQAIHSPPSSSIAEESRGDANEQEREERDDDDEGLDRSEPGPTNMKDDHAREEFDSRDTTITAAAEPPRVAFPIQHPRHARKALYAREAVVVDRSSNEEKSSSKVSFEHNQQQDALVDVSSMKKRARGEEQEGGAAVVDRSEVEPPPHADDFGYQKRQKVHDASQPTLIAPSE